MSRIVKGGLVQVANARQEGAVKEILQAMLEKTLPFVDQAAKAGVQILCLQEVFNAPYFCPAQTPNWYEAAEAVPGPTTHLLAEYARKHRMVIVVPVYEREMAGVYYNTAAVIDADGKYLGKYRKNHIPQTHGFWEKYYFKPGNLGYPVFKTQYADIGVYICYDRHFPEGARLLGLNGAEIVFNPSATVAGLSQYLWKLVFRRPAGELSLHRQRGQRRADHRRAQSGIDRGGSPHLAILPRSAPGDLPGPGQAVTRDSLNGRG